jgi:hypothetical protein
MSANSPTVSESILRYNAPLTIVAGKNRKSLEWGTVTIHLSSFYDILSRVQRTPETTAEFDRMDKEVQDNLKDRGGYVGGALTGKQRLKGAVATRSLITLDADKLDSISDLWDTWKEKYGYNAFLHTTRKHRPSAPRARLIIPTNRHMSPEEYVFISRTIADDLGSAMFDDTTHQPERLMFWPTASADGEFIFYVHDAPLLDVDKFLSLFLGLDKLFTLYDGTAQKKWVTKQENIATTTEQAEYHYPWMREQYPDNTRTTGLTGLIGVLFSHGIDLHLAWQLVTSYNKVYFDPPLDQSKLKHTFESYMRRHKKVGDYQ